MSSSTHSAAESVLRRSRWRASRGNHEQPAGTPPHTAPFDRPAPVHASRHVRWPGRACGRTPDVERRQRHGHLVVAAVAAKAAVWKSGHSTRCTSPGICPNGPLQQLLASVVGVRRLISAGGGRRIRLAARCPGRQHQDRRARADRVGPRPIAAVPAMAGTHSRRPSPSRGCADFRTSTSGSCR